MQETEIVQGSMDWYRQRLGKFTGSRIGELMTKPRNGERFSKTALRYIHEVFYERILDKRLITDDSLFAAYLHRKEFSTPYMKRGQLWEPLARNLYAEVTKQVVIEMPCITHAQIPCLAASPDGYICGDESRGVFETKSPKESNLPIYLSINDAKSLKKIKARHYWQVLDEMACTGAAWGDYAVYNPHLPLHIVRIERNEADINQMLETVAEANRYVETLVKKYFS